MKQSPIIVQQHDETDCGVACLLSVIRHYQGDSSLAHLREISGTSILGTSLLGLQQAAQQMGLQADAFEVDDIATFKEEAYFPCILHIVVEQKLEHYVVCYSRPCPTLNYYTIGDPAKGMETWTEEQLMECWKSRAVLLLKPTQNFEVVAQNNKKKIEWFKELIREDAPMLTIAIVLGILLAVLGMATAIFSQKLLDEILPKHQTQRLWWGMALLTILLVAQAGIGYLRGFFLLRQSRDFNNRLMGDFYKKLLQLPKAFFDTRKTGDIMARLNDTRRIQQVINYLVGNVVIDALIFIISVAFIFSYSVLIGILALFSLPLFGFLIWRFNTPIVHHQKAVMSQYAHSESHFVDAITGISAIKATNNELFFGQIGKGLYEFFQQKIYELGAIGNRYGFWNSLLNAGLITLILTYASFAVLQKQLQIGEMMAILSIAGGLIGAVGRLATTNIQLQEAKIAFERMYEFAQFKNKNNTNNLQNNPIHGGGYSLSINNLSFRFTGRKQLLSSVSLVVKQGEIVTLLGEVGSGKSILLQILQQFQDFEQGEIIINDSISLREISSKIWRNTLGVVPQEIKIFNGTVLENIVLGNVLEEVEKAIAFCKELGFDTYFEALPQNYFTIVGEEGVNLSGGQKQLIALARALYRKPSLLLLDEATASMDSQTEKFVIELLENKKSSMGILIITHRNSISNVADRVYRLANGTTTIESE